MPSRLLSSPENVSGDEAILASLCLPNRASMSSKTMIELAGALLTAALNESSVMSGCVSYSIHCGRNALPVLESGTFCPTQEVHRINTTWGKRGSVVVTHQLAGHIVSIDVGCCAVMCCCAVIFCSTICHI